MFFDALFNIDLQDLCKCLLLAHKDKFDVKSFWLSIMIFIDGKESFV